MIDLYWPATLDERLACVSAIVTLSIGLLFLLMPRLSFRIFYVSDLNKASDAPSLIGRGAAGFPLGLGVSCILLAQPILWGALGLCWGIAALGRIASLIFDNVCDNGKIPRNLLLLTFEIILAFFPLAYFFETIL